MSTVEEIQTAIESLPQNEYERLRNWLSEKDFQWLKEELRPGLEADESEFVEVTAEEVIRRCREKPNLK